MSSRLLTPEEYLDLEADAEFRSDYDAGRVTPKLGGTVNHNLICGNCCCLLKLALKEQNYETFVIDIKIRLRSITSTKPSRNIGRSINSMSKTQKLNCDRLKQHC